MHCALHKRASTPTAAMVHPIFIMSYRQPAAAGEGAEDQHCSFRKVM